MRIESLFHSCGGEGVTSCARAWLEFCVMKMENSGWIVASWIVLGCSPAEPSGGRETRESGVTSTSSGETGEPDTMGESGDTQNPSESTETEAGCVEGEQDCACGPGNACEGGLVCAEGLCLLPSCGDGVRSGDEECDDGGSVDSDGCNADCQLTKVVAVDAGGEHTCALLNSGDVKCWGRSNFGQLGQGNTNIIGDAEHPASVGVVALGAKAVDVQAGDLHSCALLESGEVMCWGSGGDGRLGYGNTDAIGDDELPWAAGVVNTGGSVVALDVGYAQTCVILESGYATCWGNNGNRQLGVNNSQSIGDDETPGSVGVINAGDTLSDIVTGGSHSCALRDDEELVCWGRNHEGQLGIDNSLNADWYLSENNIETLIAQLPFAPVQLDLGGSHSCAVLANGRVSCWGTGASGRLGYGDIQDQGDDEPPGDTVQLGPVTPVQVTTGDEHTCALLQGGEVMCWGEGADGRLGYGNTERIGDNELPADAGYVDVGGPVRAITAGKQHTCALRNDDGVVCWGEGDYGRLGYAGPDSIGDDELPAGTVQVF